LGLGIKYDIISIYYILGFCSDSFEPGTGMIKCRTFLPTKIETKKSIIKDVQCGKTFTAFITNKSEVKN